MTTQKNILHPNNPERNKVVSNRRHFLAGATTLLAASFMGVGGAFADAAFRRFIGELRQAALNNGVAAQVFDRAFSTVNDPDPEVLRKAIYQPEFNEAAWSYFDNRVNEDSIATGQFHAKKWQRWLGAIHGRFSVDPTILLAIWSLETSYGEAMQRQDVMRDTIRSLATLAYGDKKRAKYARTQLIAALKILQRGDIDRGHLSGSWAGAMGHTQFIPTSYMQYAVDMDGDGRRDIWTSVPDALASAANLLRSNGWQKGQTWGYEVVLPPSGKFPNGAAPLSQWQALGVRRANGKPFPNGAMPATLKLPQGREGPIFLVTKNFFVIKRYNNSDRYALAVGLLADRIAGYPGLVRDWSRPFTPISLQERKELQNHLHALGYYDGKIDGKIGAVSQDAIKDFQRRNGMAVNGHPSREVLMRLRSR